MDENLRFKLIEIMLSLPVTHTHTGRTTLLAGFTRTEICPRDLENPFIDISLLISFADTYDEYGNWMLQKLIKNVSFSVQGTEKGRQLHNILQQLQGIRTPSVHQLIESYNFDLQQIVDECLDRLIAPPGLICFAIHCNSQRFLKNLCLRLRQAWTWCPGKIQIKELLKLEAPHTSATVVVNKISRLRPLLPINSILIPVQVPSISEATYLWQALRNELGSNFPNHLVIVIGIMADEAPLHEMMILESPKFRKSHVLQWVGQIIERLNWPRHFISEWADSITQYCSHNDELNIDSLYEHLEEDIPALFQEYSTPESFLGAVQRLKG